MCDPAINDRAMEVTVLLVLGLASLACAVYFWKGTSEDGEEDLAGIRVGLQGPGAATGLDGGAEVEIALHRRHVEPAPVGVSGRKGDVPGRDGQSMGVHR